MKTKLRTAITVATTIITLAFASASFGQSPPQPPGGGSTNDPPTPEELEAMWQAYLAQLATNRASIEPWLIGTLDLTEPPPEPESADAVLQQKLCCSRSFSFSWRS